MASSPGGHSVRKPICDEDAVPQYSYPYPSPLHSRTGALASLLRSRSQQSLDAVAGAGDEESRLGPLGGSHVRGDAVHDEIESLLRDETRLSQVLNGPMARSMKLIGRSKRYRWEDYWKSESALACMNSRIRAYYERTNSLIQQYLYIDRLLDSSIPHDLLSEYGNELEASAFGSLAVPATIAEEASVPSSQSLSQTPSSSTARPLLPQKRMPSDIFRPSEHMPLLHADGPDRDDDDDAVSLSCAAVRPKAEGPRPHLPWLENADLESNDPIVTLAIWINLVANLILLAGKVAVIASVPSMSVLASLVDALLDLLSTFIVWTTTRLISAGQRDQYSYPIGRSRLEPLGVLVFSIIMVTSFCQVSLECIQRLASPEHAILQLGTPSLVILIGTIVIKGTCWLWTRLVRNSSVRALAEDAKTDVVFNLGSILFPIVGFYGSIWWLDAFGGLVLSLFVISVWGRTSAQHIRNLTGFSAQPDERNLLLYLTMRFATAIRQIQNLRAYHAGDKLVVEVDIVLSANTPLKDSHDLSEVLTYFLESVPIVDRAFVHVDYLSYNAPTHMLKQRDP